VKASLVMLAALAAAACLRKRSAALRHWLISAAIVAAAAAPLLGLVTPAWHVPLDALSRPRLAAIAPATIVGGRSPREAAGTSRSGIVGVDDSGVTAGAIVERAWIAGAGVSLLILCVGLGRLAWIASKARRVAGGRWAEIGAEVAREYGLRRPVAILQSDQPALLVTWGFVQPQIILPRTAQEWPDARIRVVLSHELAHIRRGDWLIQMLAEVARAGYWFNPVMWVACRQLRQESEQATDDVVLHAGIDGSEYAAHLLDLARAFSRRDRGDPGEVGGARRPAHLFDAHAISPRRNLDPGGGGPEWIDEPQDPDGFVHTVSCGSGCGLRCAVQASQQVAKPQRANRNQLFE